MTPRIKSEQLCHLVPLEENKTINPNDVVLCHVSGKDYLHLVVAIKGHETGTRYLIGNNHGGINGWIPRTKIFGLLVKVED